MDFPSKHVDFTFKATVLSLWLPKLWVFLQNTSICFQSCSTLPFETMDFHSKHTKYSHVVLECKTCLKVIYCSGRIRIPTVWGSEFTCMPYTRLFCRQPIEMTLYCVVRIWAQGTGSESILYALYSTVLPATYRYLL